MARNIIPFGESRDPDSPHFNDQAALYAAGRMKPARFTEAEVKDAVDALPEAFRMAVLLADVEGFSYKEIAEIMDCPAGTVMSRLYRGRKILQGLLYDYAVEQGIISSDASGAAGDAASGASAGKKSADAVAQTLDLDAFRRQKRAGRDGDAE